MTDPQPPTRAQRRARTRTAILDAARRTFAENGYQKATIRAVAERAGFDPALVMQHFGSKQALFRAATEIDLDVTAVLDGTDATLGERTLRHTFERLDAQPQAAASTLRSMLTHDEFAAEALKLFNPPDAMAGSAELDGDGRLRQQLVIGLILGTAIIRYVLPYPEVRNAGIDELVACLGPAVDALDHSDHRGSELPH